MLYLLFLSSYSSVSAKLLENSYLILNTVLICVLILKFSALNCFKIDVTSYRERSESLDSGNSNSWSIMEHNNWEQWSISEV